MLIRELPQEARPIYNVQTNGARSTDIVNLLACLIPSEDALGIAQRVMSRFGDLRGLWRASSAELEEVDGIGPANATRIMVALELGRRSLNELKHEIKGPQDLYNMYRHLSMLEREEFHVVGMNTRAWVLLKSMVYCGAKDTILVVPADVMTPLVRIGASNFAVLHNHPSGDPTPSPEDVATTSRLKEAGELLGITMLDHVIVGARSYVSLKERNWGCRPWG